MSPAPKLDLDTLTLTLFVAVCEETSINRAAERERIAASALSRRMSDLEAQFKLSLFRRHARGVEPTPAGLALLRHARVLLRDMAQMRTEMSDHTSGLKGTIRLQANVWAIVQYLPEQLHSFLQVHPGLNVEIEEALSNAMVKSVAERAADIGIIGSNVPAPDLQVMPYRRDQLYVVMPADHPLADRESLRLGDLVPYDIIGSKRGSALDLLLMRGMAELGETLQIRVRISGPETMCRMAETGLGIGLTAQYCALRHKQSMRLEAVPLDEVWAWRELSICVNKGPLSPQVSALVDHLRQQS